MSAISSHNPRRWRSLLLLAPVVIFLLAFFVVPLFQVLLLSVSDPGWSLEHYYYLFSDGFFIGVLSSTFLTALGVTLVCLALGYPLAYTVVRLGGGFAKSALVLVGLSLWVSFLVRTYAWMVILGNRGPIVALLDRLGLGNGELLFTRFSSTLGMVHALLPLMVMTLYSVMRKIDPAYIRAARGLGASSWAAFRHVFLPLSAPAIVNGCTLVFITCLGFYVMPVLLGGPGEQMLAGLIGQQIEELLNFGEAAAMSVVLLVASLSVYAVYNHAFGIDKLWGEPR
ncbi:ABC transporter permease [Bordetella sp. BOR01]|uniref:ABC transporter permease n=1 Tax=Bordetella sp. BOR01 TaxID=2854779 RepID=UPI001C443D80|nr:ABC transporter permease [Bordetella sp. BOR01]MBV7487080.1 ABC transporter permease [Bordetella sp. BOR01]